MATSSLSILLNLATNLADKLTIIINAMEVAAARRHRARILGLMSVLVFQDWTLGSVES